MCHLTETTFLVGRLMVVNRTSGLVERSIISLVGEYRIFGQSIG